MVDLFLFFVRSKGFTDICWETEKFASDFAEFREVVNGYDKVPQYVSHLVEIAANIGKVVGVQSKCYIFSALDDISKISLQIMKSGLKRAITTETEEIVKSFKS